MRIQSFAFSSPGGREENQDHVSVREENNTGIYVLADGLGGHEDGKKASELAAKWLELSWKPGKIDEPKAWLNEQFHMANRLLEKYAEMKTAKVRTTLVALMLDEKSATWAHTGDSRLYYFHGSRIDRFTADHSVAYKKFKSGEISRTEIGRDDDQNALLKTLGSADRWEPDTDNCSLEPGDAFLLCSDGFWEYVRDEEILFDLLKSTTPREWAEHLLVRVMGRIEQGNDNLSLITVMVE